MATETGLGYVRVAAMQEALGAAGADLLALAPTDNLRYALGGFSPPGDERFCALLVAKGGVGMVIPSLNLQQARENIQGVPFFQFSDEDGPILALAEALAAVQGASASVIAVDEEMRADHLLILQAAFLRAVYRPAAHIVDPFRSRKETAEIDILKAAALTADAGVQAVFAAIRPGITEAELVDIAGAAMRRAGADGVAFGTVGAGAHTALPHHHSGATALRAGDVVNIDIGSRLHGYCSDITRMAVVGGADPDPEFARVHAVVEAAAVAAVAAARPGVQARTVDAAARDVITDAGYGEYFVHRTGHGLGLSVHEPPYLTSLSYLVLDKGMVFSIEPGIYLPGRFGCRLEEIVYLDETGARVLSALPRAVHGG